MGLGRRGDQLAVDAVPQQRPRSSGRRRRASCASLATWASGSGCGTSSGRSARSGVLIAGDLARRCGGSESPISVGFVTLDRQRPAGGHDDDLRARPAMSSQARAHTWLPPPGQYSALSLGRTILPLGWADCPETLQTSWQAGLAWVRRWPQTPAKPKACKPIWARRRRGRPGCRVPADRLRRA